MQNWFDYFSIILIVFGLFCRVSAVAVNGSFTLVPKLPDAICSHGIYKHIRHPAYLGTICTVFGAAYLFGSLLTACLFGYLFYIVLADRARIEEQLIEKELPNLYEIYKKNTGFFLPKLF